MADANLAETLAALDQPVDILIINAGTIPPLSGQFMPTREIGRRMLERGHGKVIFTASLFGFQGVVNVPGYVATGNTRTARGPGPQNAAILERIPAWRGRGPRIGWVPVPGRDSLR